MMFQKILLCCTVFSTALANNLSALEDIQPTPEQVVVEIQASGIDLLDDLDRKTEDIINRSHTTPEDMARETHIPTWKKWMMQAGDFVYWSLQTGVDTVQALYSRCKKTIIGSHGPEEPTA